MGRESVDGKQLTSGIIECSTCGHEGPLNVLILEHADPLARLKEVRLADLGDRDWIMFERHVNQQFYDRFQRTAAEDKITPSDMQHVTSAEEVPPLILGHNALGFLTRMGAWRINRDGINIRPLADDRLQLTTCLAARADEKSRLVSEFLRTSVRKVQSVTQPEQKQLPLAV